jgi:hypothetical protein
MKRSIVLFLVLGMIFGSIASAEAAKKKKPKKVSRTVEGSYDAPALIVAGTCSQTCVGHRSTRPGRLRLRAGRHRRQQPGRRRLRELLW